MPIDWLVLLAALTSGLLGGLHCVAMCGGIATGFSAASPQQGWMPALQLNLGRVGGYVLAGAIVGALGHGLLSILREPWIGIALRMLVGLFEDAGFRAVSVAQAAPGLVADEGPLGRILPGDDHKADIARAFSIVRALGALDVGQAAAVCEGLALAVEAAEGTDAMIARIGQLRDR